MKMTRSKRRTRTSENSGERLEARQLLSATVSSQIPTQSVTAGQTSAAISLGTYFNDPVVTGTAVVLTTPLGNVPLVLTDSETPKTVANFKEYITSGEYTNTIIHRSVPGFVIQGGGYTSSGSMIQSFGTIPGEHDESNSTGTIAMALSTGPNSATSEWFINLADNTELDNTSDGGPFTAFGSVVYNGMSVVDAIANLPVVDDTQNGAWNTIPVQSGTNGATVSTEPASNLVTTDPEIIPGGLTYTASSSKPSLVTASINSSSGALTLTSVGGSGSASITVTATDMGGGTASSTFTVNVPSAPTLPVVSIANASATASSSAQVVFPVTLSAASSSAVTLDYALSAGTAPASDFAATGSSLTIAAGSTTANIPVNILADSTGASETFSITLSSLSTDATFTGGAGTVSATGTILPSGTITPAATTTSLTASTTAVAEGAADTFVATVAPATSGATPTGTVTFSINGTTLGSQSLANGTATLTNILSTPGSQAITAIYSGNGTYAASTSSAVTVDVDTLTPTVARNTIPSAVVAGAPASGTFAVTATNNTSSTEKGLATFAVYASTDGEIDANSVLIASVKRSVNLKVGESITVPIPVKSLPANLSSGAYTLLGQTTDPSGDTSDAASGPSVTVSAPLISLSESIVKLPLPAAVVAGSKTSAAAVLRIANGGNITSSGNTTITLLASPDGTVASGTAFKSITRRLSIRAGKSTEVTVPLGAFPTGADGNYLIVAEVTDPNGGVSSIANSTPVNIAAAKIDLANAIAAVPAAGQVGKSISVTLEVTNDGNISAAGNLQIAFSASTASNGANPFSLETVSTRINLAPGRTQAVHVKVSLPLGMPTGQLYLVSTLDPNDVFNDVDLANNTAISSSFITVS